MKKMFILILTICSCYFIFSCNQQEANLSSGFESGTLPSSSESVAGSQPNAETDVDSNTSMLWDENNNVGNADGIDEAFLIIDSLQAYEEYLSNNKITDDFVDFKAISKFGKFECFTIPSMLPLEYVREYWYDFSDNDGQQYSLHVFHDFEEPEQPYKLIQNTNQSVDSSDLRTVDTQEAGIYEKNGIMYFYASSGSLLRIRWNIGNTVVFLEGTNLPKMDISSENITTIGKLLKEETAKNELLNMFGEKFAK